PRPVVPLGLTVGLALAGARHRRTAAAPGGRASVGGGAAPPPPRRRRPAARLGADPRQLGPAEQAELPEPVAPRRPAHPGRPRPVRHPPAHPAGPPTRDSADRPRTPRQTDHPPFGRLTWAATCPAGYGRDMGDTHEVRLADGRTVGDSDDGGPAGPVVLTCVGTPDSRLVGRWLVERVEQLGVRIVVPDRPGFGRSDPLPGRTLTDWPSDAAALVDALGVDRVA